MKCDQALWWNPERMRQVREAIAHGDPDALFLEQQTRRRVESDDVEDGCHGWEPRAVLAWLEQDADEAVEVMRAWVEASTDGPTSNLGEAGWALSGAVIADILSELLPDAERVRAAEALWSLVRRLRVPTKGNPHVVTNNWWAVTHGAALCAALEAQRLAGRSADGADPEAVPWALGRLRSFCHHFGPAGLYHEGLGYIRYTCIFVLSAVQACRSTVTADLLEEFPNLRNLLPSLYAATIARPYQDDTIGGTDRHGASLSWNDMGAGAGVSCVDHIGMAIAPPQLRPSLKAWFDRLTGRLCPQPTLGGHHVCLPMAWAYMPIGEPDADVSALPTLVQDSRQGFWIWRDGYRGPEDVVVGIYSKATHAGGHHHEDAGSMRIDAFGSDWMAGPGQARPAKLGQSVMFPADGEKNLNRSHLNFQELREDGFCVSMDMRKSSGAYHERLIAIQKSVSDAAPPLLLAQLDVVDDHKHRDWTWTWTFARTLEVRLDGDGCGARLSNGRGMYLHLRFLESRPDRLELEELPSSQRTYAGGNTERYLGKPLLKATFAPSPHLAVLVAGIWSTSPELRISGGVHELCVENLCWARPFGAALPAGFRPGVSSGPSQNSLP